MTLYQHILLSFLFISKLGFTYVNKQKFEEIKYQDKENEISVTIENDVWIGENASILGGVKIGNGAIIGANSLVTKDIEPYSINVGSPSRIIGYRFKKEDIEFLQKLQWWDKNEEWIKNNRDLFESIEKIRDVI